MVRRVVRDGSNSLGGERNTIITFSVISASMLVAESTDSSRSDTDELKVDAWLPRLFTVV